MKGTVSGVLVTILVVIGLSLPEAQTATLGITAGIVAGLLGDILTALEK